MPLDRGHFRGAGADNGGLVGDFSELSARAQAFIISMAVPTAQKLWIFPFEWDTSQQLPEFVDFVNETGDANLTFIMLELVIRARVDMSVEMAGATLSLVPDRTLNPGDYIPITWASMALDAPGKVFRYGVGGFSGLGLTVALGGDNDVAGTEIVDVTVIGYFVAPAISVF